MVKRKHSRAYTVVESVVVLMILSLVLLCSVPLFHHDVSMYALKEWFISEMAVLQQQAYLNNVSYDVEVSMDELQLKHVRNGNFEGNDFQITKLGRVNHAVSLQAYNRHSVLKWKVWLGMGRIHFER